MTTLTSSGGSCTFGTGYPTVLATTLINTLKNETLTKDLIAGKVDEVKRLAEKQVGDGTGFLEVMIVHPQIDEEVMLPLVCKAAHDATGLPLYIDSTNINAIRRTLDIYPYKPVLSVSADSERLEPMLNLVKESGSAVICLCMDDKGIPATAVERMAIAERIIQRAREIGIPDDDIAIDPLVMAMGVSEPDSMLVAFDVLRAVKQKYQFSTFLGIENAGYGLPYKESIDLAYLLAAIPAGMDVALIDPPLCTRLGQDGLTLIFAENFLSGRDPYAKKYLAYLRKNDLIKRRKQNDEK